MTPSATRLVQRCLDGRAPRYTSYPPANHFTDAVGPDLAARWLGDIPKGAAVSVYVHIPFCRRLCWFCACRTQGTRSDAPLAPYLDALETELTLLGGHLPEGLRVAHLHIGGGTPTFLSAAMLRRLFAMLDAHLPRASGAEVSVEVDPTELGPARLDTLAECGVTRASLGVQDFDERVQQAIGRPQSFEQTREAVEGLRNRGIGAINLDLLYGLPLQDGAGLERTLDAALSLAPGRMALYGYAHVPWASKRQAMIREDDLPSPSARLELAMRAGDRIEAAGYAPVGIDHYAKPGDALARAAAEGGLRRNFQGYTTDPAPVLLGLGASSISLLPGGFAQNAPRTADWKAALRRGVLPVARGHALTGEDRLRGRAIERFLCDLELAPETFAEGERKAVRDMARIAVRNWPGLVHPTPDGGCRIEAASRHVARMVAMHFDAYATPSGRHSVAV